MYSTCSGRERHTFTFLLGSELLFNFGNVLVTVGLSVTYPPNLHRCHCLRAESEQGCRLKPGLLLQTVGKGSSLAAGAPGCEDQGNLELSEATLEPQEDACPEMKPTPGAPRWGEKGSWCLSLWSVPDASHAAGFSVPSTIRSPIF